MEEQELLAEIALIAKRLDEHSGNAQAMMKASSDQMLIDTRHLLEAELRELRFASMALSRLTIWKQDDEQA